MKKKKSNTAQNKMNCSRLGRIQPKYNFILAGLLLATGLQAQEMKTEADSLFVSDHILELKISTDLHTLSHERKKEKYQHAHCTILWHDGDTTVDTLSIKPRGYNRKEQCIFPPITLNFKHSSDSMLRTLETIKLVMPCSRGSVSEQLVLREYLVYMMYHLLTEKSFQTRLLRVELSDPEDRIKTFAGYAFFLEDENSMAGRNQCYALKRPMKSAQLDTYQLDLMYVFQYMIGNTDFTVDANKNIKLIRSFVDGSLQPYVVPYDFDYSGMVHAGYAMPHTDYQDKITNVMDRLYLGPAIDPKTMDALIRLFDEKKEQLFSLIRNFSWLTEHNKKEMILFLNEFYKDIHQPQKVREVFITGSIYQ